MADQAGQSKDSVSTGLMKGGCAFGGLGCMLFALAPIIAVVGAVLLYPLKDVVGSPIGWVFILMVLFFVGLYAKSERQKKTTPKPPDKPIGPS